jgi:hypothetical protein
LNRKSGSFAPALKKNFAVLDDRDWVEVLPWSLHSMADAPNFGAEEKIGHSGRDDKTRKSKKWVPPRAQPGMAVPHVTVLRGKSGWRW